MTSLRRSWRSLCPSAAQSLVCDDRAQILADSDCHIRENPHFPNGLGCDTWFHEVETPIRAYSETQFIDLIVEMEDLAYEILF